MCGGSEETDVACVGEEVGVCDVASCTVLLVLTSAGALVLTWVGVLLWSETLPPFALLAGQDSDPAPAGDRRANASATSAARRPIPKAFPIVEPTFQAVPILPGPASIAAFAAVFPAFCINEPPFDPLEPPRDALQFDAVFPLEPPFDGALEAPFDCPWLCVLSELLDCPVEPPELLDSLDPQVPVRRQNELSLPSIGLTGESGTSFPV